MASHLGGEAPLDPNSVKHFASHGMSMKFYEEHESLWKNTAKLEDFIGKADDFAAIFYVGSYGPMFDLVDSRASEEVITEFHSKHKIVSAVCHGPAVFSRLKLPGTGNYVLEGHKVIGISDYEIESLSSGLIEPFSVEGTLNTATGGKYEKDVEPAKGRVVVSKGKDGRVFITGQNPYAGVGLAKAVFEEIFGKAWSS